MEPTDRKSQGDPLRGRDARFPQASPTSGSAAGREGLRTPSGPFLPHLPVPINEENPLAICVSTLWNDHVLDVNEALVALCGYSREEILGKSLEELGIWVNPNDFQRMAEELIAGSQLQSCKTLIHNKAGELRVVSIVAYIVEINNERCIFSKITRIMGIPPNGNNLFSEGVGFSSMLEDFPVGIWIMDAEGKILGKNKASDAIWAGNNPVGSGYEAYGEFKAWDAKTGEPYQPHQFAIVKTLESGQLVGPVELRIERFDGSEGFVLLSSIPILSSEGQVLGGLAFNFDITNLKLIERKLHKTNLELEKKVSVQLTDLDTYQRLGKIGSWQYELHTDKFQGSEELYRIFVMEKPAGQETSATFLDRVHREDRNAVNEVHARAVKNGLPFDLQFRILTDNGDLKWIRQLGQVVHNPDSEHIVLAGTVQDITVVKTAETKLRQQSDNFRSIFADSPDGLALLQSDGTIVTSNPSLQRILGYLDWELDGKEFKAFIPQPRGVIDQVLETLFETREKFNFHTETSVQRKDGQYRTIDMSFTRTGSVDGETDGIIYARLDDITE